MKTLSVITENFTESVIREMTRICLSIGGINMSQGFPDFDTPEELKAHAVTAITQGRNQYPVTYGEPILRERIAEKAGTYNRIHCDPDTEITVCCGATEAMLSTLKALINPGDEVILFEPFYENYIPDTILSGATPKFITLRPPDWSFDLHEMEAAFTRNTKAIVLNTPNNPTGKVFSQEELSIIASLCQKWDAYAVTDEIYEHILYDGTEHISIASLEGMAERTVTINSISKTYAATGWRVGWAIAPKPITERIRKVHDFVSIGAPTPFQHAAAAALHFPEHYYTSLAEKYCRSRDYFVNVLEECGFKPYFPKGAYYVMAETETLRRKLGADNSADFSRKLIHLSGIATVPGYAFYSHPEMGINQVRFCFCKKKETLEAAADGLRQALLSP